MSTSKEMADDLGLTIPIVADEDRSVTKAFGVWDEPNDIAWPAVVVVGADGKVEWRDIASSYTLDKRPTAAELLEVLR